MTYRKSTFLVMIISIMALTYTQGNDRSSTDSPNKSNASQINMDSNGTTPGTGPTDTTYVLSMASTSTGISATTHSTLKSRIKVPFFLSTSAATFKEFQTITLICQGAIGMNLSWKFRHATSYFVKQYGYNASMSLNFFSRFKDRYAVSETVITDSVTSVLKISSVRPGDRGWYTCIDVQTNASDTNYVEFVYDGCRDNGVYTEEFGCIEFISEDECTDKNGSLAVIHSNRKDKWIYDLAFHLDKATTSEVKLGLKLSANTMLWKDFTWDDGSSLTFVEWLLPGLTSVISLLMGNVLRKDKKSTMLSRSTENEWALVTDRYTLIMARQIQCFTRDKQTTMCSLAFESAGTEASCRRCLVEKIPVPLGIKFHMDVLRVWQWTNTKQVACEWRTQPNITGIRIVPGNTSYTGDKELFRCKESGEHISSEFVCDTVRDCWDQSDEEDCGPECSGTSFQCTCGGCVSASNVCDFYKDCADGSDEDHCGYPSCAVDYWECNNRECIPPYDVCDGEIECADGSDEADSLCKENQYTPTAYSHICAKPNVIFPSARLCDGVRDCIDVTDENYQDNRCPHTVYSCGSLMYATQLNTSNVAVNVGLFEYGATNVACTVKPDSVDTNWPFEQATTGSVSTYSGKPLKSKALWISVSSTIFTPIKYTNSKTQLQLISMATSCVQYIRACVNVMGRAKGNVSVEWTCGENEDQVNSLTISVESCSGYCSASECKFNPSIQNTQIPASPAEAAMKNWAAITDKNQLPLSKVKGENIIILGISPLICTEAAVDIDPRYKEEPKFCKNGMIYYPHNTCLMDFDPTGEPTGCRDLTHLEDCGEFECPENYIKCPGSFCLHQRFLCDGKSHCPLQEDELACDSGMCDGHYKCRMTYECIPFNQLCDGIRHCRRGDDEFNCNPRCPANCRCRGMTFKCESHSDIIPINTIHSDARWIDLKTNMSDMRPHNPIDFRFLTTLLLQGCSIRELLVDGQSVFGNIRALRHLDLSSNHIEKLPKKTFIKTNLKTLVLSNNPLSHIDSDFFHGFASLNNLQMTNTSLKILETGNPLQSIFRHLTDLEYLDLSFNLIENIPGKVFTDLLSLKYLNLSHNPVSIVDLSAFSGLHFLRDLRLTHTKIQEIHTGVFDDVSSLIYLNISAGDIRNIQNDVFLNLGRLQALDIQQNLLEIHELMFKGLDGLTYLYADSYKMCCIRPESVASENCFALQESISSCSNLVGLGILRVCLWVIGITALVGNVFVIIYRAVIDKKHIKKSYSLFVINLGVSDFLMGVYMLIIAAVDTHYSGRYVTYDKKWRESTFCAVAGIISMISSEMSTFIILLITIDRFIAIVFPLSTHKFTWRKAIIAVNVFWFVTLAIAVTPQVFFQTYFKGKFYSRSGICLALPLTGDSSPGDEYAVAIFIGMNSLVFLLIVMAQFYIYKAMKGSGSLATTQNRKTEMELAKSLFLVVATDFCCWCPIGVIGLWSQTGGIVSQDVYAWVMVMVLPINSAINPFLYTYTYIKRKRRTSTRHSCTNYTSDRRSTSGSTKNQQMFYDAEQTNALKEVYFSKLFESTREYISLETHIRDQLLSPADAFKISQSVIICLSFLHARGIVHGNVSKECVRIKTSKQVLRRAALVMEANPIPLKYEGPHVDVLQYGMLVKNLLRRLSKR